MPRRRKNSSKSSKGNAKKKTTVEESGIEKFGQDEVDAFHSKREYVVIDTKKDQEESSEDEAVMGLDDDESDSSSSSEEEEEEEEEQREDAVDIRTGVASEDSSSSSSSEEDDEEEEEEDAETLGRRAIGWGTKRKTFYASDEEEAAEDSDDEALQVEEAKRQQKMRAKATKDVDFEIDDSDEDENGKKDKDEENEIERIDRDPSLVSAEEKLARLRNEAPELLALLSDFKEKSSELRNTIRPVLSKVRAGELATESGVDYLEVKHQLLLNYCINLTFYLYLRARGQSVSNHPVIKQLVHLRTIMEKLQPIDKKVRYQIDKLLEKTSASSKTDDATRFGPNVDDLAIDEEDGGEDEENGGLYRAPRMTAVMYDPDDSESAKEERKREKTEARLKKSAILKELHEEWTDQPLKRSATGAAGHTGNEELEQWQRERVRYEEENFVRLQPTKKRKKQIKAASRSMNSAAFGDLTDFGDIELLQEQNDDAIATKSLRRDHTAALHRQINQLEQKRRQIRKRGATSGDADHVMDPDVLEARRRKQNDRARDLMEESYEDRFTKAFNSNNKDDEMLLGNTGDAEDDFYKQSKKSQTDRKRKRKEKYAVEPMMTAADEVTDGSRLATRQILKNRGLVPHRKRENRNPRIVRKKKYEKAKKRRKGQVRELRTGEANQYGGEMSGIRTDISRSRMMK